MCNYGRSRDVTVIMLSVVHLNFYYYFFYCMHISSFLPMLCFSVNLTHSVLHEAPEEKNS